MMNRQSIIMITLFGTLWGAVEASLGTIIHMFRLPFAGSLLSGIGLIILLYVRKELNIKGTAIMMGLVAGTIKMITFSTVKLGPFAGIVMEGIIVEVIMILLGPTKPGFFLSGVFTGIYPIIQNLFVKTVLFGMGFIPVLLDLADGVSESLGFGIGWWILIFYVVAHILIGCFAAWAAWVIIKQTRELLKSQNIND